MLFTQLCKNCFDFAHTVVIFHGTVISKAETGYRNFKSFFKNIRNLLAGICQAHGKFLEQGLCGVEVDNDPVI